MYLWQFHYTPIFLLCPRFYANVGDGLPDVPQKPSPKGRLFGGSKPPPYVNS